MVVIVIIGMLVGLLLPAFNRTRQRGKVTEGKSEAAAIKMAVKAYFLEYGSWPCPPADAEDPRIHTYASGNVTDVLSMLRVSNTADNPRRVPFLDFDNFQMDAGGTTVLGPWDEAYRIEIDTRYPGQDAALQDGVRVSFLNWRGERIYP